MKIIINIPEKINEKCVAVIGNNAFANCSKISSVNIPNSVIEIGDGAFTSCRSLTSINIPNSVTTIEKNTFIACKNLTTVNIPNSIKKIEENAFSGCSLTSIKMPNSIIEIGKNAFSDCSITSIIIPDSVVKIGDRAFSNCSKLTTIDIPNSVIEIGNWTFNSCSLTSINIPDGVKKIGDCAFVYCSKLTTINIPDSVIEIGEGAFSSCKNLTSIDLPDSIRIIKKNTFCRCNSLTTINIPDYVIEIEEGAFGFCENLITINISINTIINDNAYYRCPNLTVVKLPDKIIEITNSFKLGLMTNPIPVRLVFTNSAKKTFSKLFYSSYNMLELNNNLLDIDLEFNNLLGLNEYDVYLSNATTKNFGDNVIDIVIATDSKNENNKKFMKEINEETFIFKGVNKPSYSENKFLVIALNKVKSIQGTKSNRRIQAKMSFHINYTPNAKALPIKLEKAVIGLTPTLVREKEIEKRLKDWDSYLELIEIEAKKNNIQIIYSSYHQGENLLLVDFVIKATKDELKNLKRFVGQRIGLVEKEIKEGIFLLPQGLLLGILNKVNISKSMGSIELDVDLHNKAQRETLNFPETGKLYVSKLGDLIQAKRLRGGLNKLKFGQTMNENLENFLFYSKNAQIPKEIIPIDSA